MGVLAGWHLRRAQRRRRRGRDQRRRRRWEEETRRRRKRIRRENTIRSRSRARIYPRARPLNSKLGNIASVFEELLEKNFCGFAKFIKIASSFEELLEML